MKPSEYPKLIVIGESTYHLVFADRLNEDDLGVCDDELKLILISRDQEPDEMFKTVIHECLHAIEREYRMKLGHPKIRKLEDALASVFKQLRPVAQK